MNLIFRESAKPESLKINVSNIVTENRQLVVFGVDETSPGFTLIPLQDRLILLGTVVIGGGSREGVTGNADKIKDKRVHPFTVDNG